MLENKKKIEITKEKFWQWRHYNDYLLFICILGATIAIFTAIFHNNTCFQSLLGYTSSGVEAILGVPQLLLNYRRHNTSGLSIMLIFIWLGGDLYKLTYYNAHESPLALQLCAGFQIFIDFCILGQFALYRKNTKTMQKDAVNGEEIEQLNKSTDASNFSPNPKV
jgi:solute carrier family 66, member 2